MIGEKESMNGVKRKRPKNSILIIYTGGTIGMIPDSGSEGALKPDLTCMKQELLTIKNNETGEFPEIKIVEFDEVIDSSDVTVQDWKNLAKIIEDHYYEVNGYVVIMGTDTMAYSSSALTFMLENLAKPVVFTGAMIPLFQGHSDARRNLLISIKIASTSNIPEVCIFFHDRLLRGCRTTKLRSSHLDAFASPNYPPLALFGTSLDIKETNLMKHPRKQFSLSLEMDPSVLVMRLIPGFPDDAIECLLSAENLRQKMKALVLEVYGTGNFPARKKNLVELFKKAIAQGIVIVVCSQCVYGHVDLKAYSVGIVLEKIGAVSAYDMTVECVSAKLAYLFGRGFTPDKVKASMEKSLRGELTESLVLK